MSPSRSIPIGAALVALAAAAAFAGADITLKPGGKAKIVHGTPVWRDDFEAELKPGLNWRLGSNAATTLTTEAGLVFEDCVILPGEYNLALTCEGSNEFKVVFHHDGTYYEKKKSEGAAKFDATKVSGKQVAKALAIDFTKDPEKKGYLFQITFGAHRIAQAFESAKGKTVKGKAGAKAFSATYLERTDLERVKAQLEKGDVTFARLEWKDGEPLLAKLRGGSAPKLTLRGVAETAESTSIDGKEEQAKTTATAVALAFAEGESGAKATFTVGGTNYVFDIPASVFDSSKPRGR